MPANGNEEARFRAGPQGYVVFGTIFGGLALGAAWTAVHRHASFWQAAGLCAALLVGTVIWLATFEIRITSADLRFRSLFGGSRIIAHENIRSIRLGFDLSSSGGPLRLIVESRDGTVDSMSINAKVFSSRAVRAVLDLGKRLGVSRGDGLEDGIIRHAARRRD